MKKYAKKLLVLAMVLAMVMSLGVSAYADAETILYGTGIPPATSFDCPLSSTYLNSESYETSGLVTLVIEAGDCFTWNDFGTIPNSGFLKFKTYNLSTQNNSGLTVLDLLQAADLDSSLGIDFSIVYNSNDGTYYLDCVSRDSTDWNAPQTQEIAEWYSGGEWGFDGWVFRVNDKFPVESVLGGYHGTDISTTYLHDGDIVHFFYDAPSNFDDDNIPAANYVRGSFDYKDTTGVFVNLQSHDTFIDQLDNWKMYVNAYSNSNVSGINARLYSVTYNLDNTVTYTSTNYTAVSNANGVLQFTSTVQPGEYIVMTTSVPYVFTSDSFFSGVVDDAYFSYTTGFFRITISA